MLFPAAEVRHIVLSKLTGRIFPRICIKAFPITQFFELNQSHRKQHSPPFDTLTSSSLGNFSLHPFATHAGLRKYKEESLVNANSVLDLLMNLLPALQIMWSEPATNAPALKICMKASGEILVLTGIADEA